MSVTDAQSPIRILLVEDNPHDRKIFQLAFQKSDIPTRITDCKRAEAALEFLTNETDEYDIVVSDHGLPGNSGLDLYRQMCDRRIALPFVLLTGVGNELLAVEALKLGVDDYVSKNGGQAYIEQLPTAISRVYQGHRDRIRRSQIETELEEREAKEQFLSEATTKLFLGTMDDGVTTATDLAQLPLPFFADWSLVELLNQGQVLGHVAAAHVAPARQHLINGLSKILTVKHTPGPVSSEVIRSRESRLIPQILNPQKLFEVAESDVAEIVAQLNPQSAICVPLLVRDHVLGAMWMFYSDSGRSYDSRDLSIADRLGQRAAIAIENARAYAEVRETDRRKDEFLAMLAHELRNPLAPVRTALEILRLENAESPLTLKCLATMERQVEHIVRLVDDLLDISRVMRGKITLQKQQVSLEKIVDHAVETSMPIIEGRQHELIVNLPEQNVLLDVDDTRVSQVLANLLNNAAKYTDEAGHIRLACEVKDNELVVSVCDDGIGIHPQMLPKIFDLFQQVDSSLDRSHGGLGIGLTLVSKLTEMHGGTVLAHSDGLGKGSEFVVRLPVSAVTQRSNVNSSPDANIGTNTKTTGLRILVVDDNVDAAEMLSDLLELAGHDVHTVHDGHAALAAAESFCPELILLDIGLPGISGYEVVRKLKQREELRETMIIAVTGYGQEIDRQHARNAGFDHHFVKPVPPQAIRELIAEQAKTVGVARTEN